MRHGTQSNIHAGTLRTFSEASVCCTSLTCNIPAMALNTHSPHTLLNPTNNPIPAPILEPIPEISDSSSEHNHNQTQPNIFLAPNPPRMSPTSLNDIPNLTEAVAMLGG